MKDLKRLQGTDGIRGKICTDDQFPKLKPVKILLEKGFLTPGFFEKYCYAYASLLLSKEIAVKNDSIVIGWDPRDRTEEFIQAAISGLTKAGLTAVTVGILPTPAIPLYMLQINAVGGVVLTASHNPWDQNGIKLFHGYTGMKFLPADDEELTSLLMAQQKKDLSALDMTGGVVDHSEKAKQCFIDFSTAPKNSWMVFSINPASTVLYIDASKGAMASVAEDIFSKYTFKEVIYTNLEGEINEHCGVADLEGKKRILPDEVLPKEAFFHSYETLKQMFERGQKLKEEFHQYRLTAFVFDGDGDRFFRLDYDPEKDQILVSNGDFLGIHQARFLKRMGIYPKNYAAWFVNTVESDLQSALSAAEEGYDSILTGVGDKWILLKALTDYIKASIALLPESNDESQEITRHIEGVPKPSGLEISRKWKALEKQLPKGTLNTRYLLGFEESGHCITPGFYQMDGKEKICFLGNGVKTALNTFAAIDILYGDKEKEEYFSSLETPYPTGVMMTHYIYYVDKARLEPGHRFCTALVQFLEDSFAHEFSKPYCLEQIFFPEEPSLLYFRILHEGKATGAVFVRNSGTEDKSALYLRGTRDIEFQLKKLGFVLDMYLLKQLKAPGNELAILEREVINQLQETEDLENIRKKFKSLPVDRVLKEMELKEGLINKSGERFFLTEKGKLLAQPL